ncbi:mycothiol synthase [Isoptericola variabilis]|uniref:Mycothiol acetyltransferase n=1 Tax=Isoptericola variabilis (strain 225) TaxID=743718 RepID=F6FTI4_ISOV2|nr:mycothiol synthase [Isoptericola variabilis]AEG43177.1 mycothiol biosynthesis acetyltransferase [Isoptericola variabilis 225]TWH35110.1 mycothiol synthase [Isoptericola variabilis J7]
MRIAPPLEIGPLDPAAQDAVRALAAAAERADGVAPLSEQSLLALDVDSETVTHAVAHDKHGATIGYLQVDRGGDVASAELVVLPDRRRNGVGSLLLRTAERDARLPSRSGAPDQRGLALRVWAHGDLPAARAFAAARGYSVVRELLFLARPLDPAPAAAELPAGYAVRTFRPGDDDEAWVALNARAFASHPEQGRLTVDDLHRRAREPWFDPAGFFLLTDPDGRLVGYHWTKIEPGQPAGSSDGEVYALGIDPDAQGRGLAGPLTAVGLAHLAAAGCTRAVLYVDGDNERAVRTYERAGFTRAAVDVQYARI